MRVMNQVALQTPDRKSTRLNSSHLGISYAVFCLKKKIVEKHHNEHGYDAWRHPDELTCQVVVAPLRSRCRIDHHDADFFEQHGAPEDLPFFPTQRSSN